MAWTPLHAISKTVHLVLMMMTGKPTARVKIFDGRKSIRHGDLWCVASTVDVVVTLKMKLYCVDQSISPGIIVVDRRKRDDIQGRQLPTLVYSGTALTLDQTCGNITESTTSHGE